jgi:hypothetical protein
MSVNVPWIEGSLGLTLEAFLKVAAQQLVNVRIVVRDYEFTNAGVTQIKPWSAATVNIHVKRGIVTDGYIGTSASRISSPRHSPIGEVPRAIQNKDTQLWEWNPNRPASAEVVEDPVSAAMSFAIERHRGQVDKAGQPYIKHPMRVARSVYHLGDEYFITGLLHDVVEDCILPGETRESVLALIERRWGLRVRNAVDSLSRREGPPKEVYKDFRERTGADFIGRIVGLADLTDNSDPARVEQLPVEERGVVKRYEKALKRLWELERLGAEVFGVDPRELHRKPIAEEG